MMLAQNIRDFLHQTHQVNLDEENWKLKPIEMLFMKWINEIKYSLKVQLNNEWNAVPH